jgi:hypothetical protein
MFSACNAIPTFKASYPTTAGMSSAPLRRPSAAVAHPRAVHTANDPYKNESVQKKG